MHDNVAVEHPPLNICAKTKKETNSIIQQIEAAVLG